MGLFIQLVEGVSVKLGGGKIRMFVTGLMDERDYHIYKDMQYSCYGWEWATCITKGCYSMVNVYSKISVKFQNKM